MMIPVSCTPDLPKGNRLFTHRKMDVKGNPFPFARIFTRSVFFLLATLLISVAGMGQTTRTWIPTNGGSWTTATNWNPAGVPAATDTLVINTTQTANIVSVPQMTVASLRVSGSCSLETGGNNQVLTVSSYLYVAPGVTLTMGTGKMHLTLAAGARGDIQGIYTQSSSGTAKVFTCGGDLTIGPNGYVDGPGDFLLTSTGTLRIGSVNGIVAGTVASGNIRVTGARTYDPAAAYIYNGTAAQVTGDGLPATLTNSLTIDNPTTVTLSAARTISTGTLNLVNGTFSTNNLLTLGNSVTAANATLNRSGGSITGTLQGSNWYTVIYSGNSKNSGQEFSGTGFRNLTVNMNSQQSVTLAASRTVPGTLTLTSGIINTGTFAVNLTGTLSGGNSASYINGNLQRSIAAGANSYSFPIGTSTAYAPVTLNFGASTVAGSLTGSTTNGDHSFIGLTTINSFRSVNRTWQFSVNSGLTTATYGAVFNWPVADQDVNFNYLNAVVGRFASFAWTLPTLGAKTATSIEATGMNAFGEFQVGQSCQITTINTQPTGGAICPGNSMELSVQATGEGTLTYQWRKDGQDISGATASTLTVTDAGTYSVVVTGECRSAASNDVEVTMNTATSITADPVGGIICPGQQFNLSVTALGQGTLTYQWKKDGVDIAQAVNATYAATAEGNYTVAVTGVCGTVESAAAFLKVNKATSVITQPDGGAVCLGQEITLRVNADGEGTLSYQWKKNGEDIQGATSFSYTTSTAGQYTVSVTGACGTVSSSSAEAIINPLTQINAQPKNETITYGSDVSFGLQASGTGDLSYMWMVNAGASWAQLNQGGVYGVTSVSQLDITNPAVAYSGYQYKCIVSGTCGQVESDPVTLEVKKATLNVKADDKRKTYGEVNPALTVTISGFARNENLSTSGVTGEATVQTAVNAQTDAGTYTVEPSAGTLSAPNYQFVFQNGNIIVDKATLQVKADDKSKVYGDQNPLLTASYSGFVNGQTLETSGVTGSPEIVTTADKSSVVGQYLITIDAGTLSSSNYAFSFVDGKMNIGKATISVTADDKTRIYGQENPSLTFTYNGFVNGQTMATSGITGSPSINTDATPLTGVGVYPISIAKGSLASSNYDFALANGSLSISKAVLKVTAEDKSKVYGDLNPTLTASYSGFVNGEALASSGITGAPSLTTSAVKGSGVGAYDISASEGTLSAGNYSFEFENGKLIIGKATLTIKADDKSRVYGASNPLFTANYNGFVNGETLGTSGISGTPEMSTSANEQSEVGNYDITVAEGTLSSSNYSFTLEGGKLSVTKAVITVTADDKSKIYGQSNPEFTASYNGFVNGESLATSGLTGAPSFTTDANASSPVGNYAINVSEGTLSSANYSFSYASGKLSVGKATVTITADNKSRLYGQSNPSFTASYNGFVNGETLASSGIIGTPSLASVATATSPVGAYDITASEGTLVSSNYSFQFVGGKLNVGKATVTITADNKSRIFGQENPAFTASYNGFVNGETLATSGISGTPSMATTANMQSAVGNYDITIAEGTLSSSNYSFNLVGGKLAVTKAVITVTADDKSKLYGQANPVLTASYSGFANGETLATSGVSGSPAFTTSATASSAVGNYTIEVAQGTLASSNYSFSYVSGKLSVGKATVTITADNKSRLYGQANPAFTAAYNGFVNGETLATSGISGSPSLVSVATATSPVGAYDITASAGTLVSSNYSFQFVDGKLNVGKATVTITADSKSRIFGQANPAFTASYNGFVNGETLATSGINGTPSMTTVANAQSPVGNYDITITEGALSSSNYSFNLVGGKLAVTKAVITVTADDKSKVYAQANPSFTASYSGFANGETLATSGVSGSPALTSSATASSSVGNYTIEVAQGTLASSNYSFSFVSGKLSIGKATVNITADNKSRLYGQVNPSFTASYNGFVNGETLATSGVTGTPSFATAANAASPVGVYDITVSEGTLTSTNYAFSYSGGKLSVEKATVKVKADDKVKVFGDPNPSLTASYIGLANGETLATSGITGSPVLTTTAELNSPVGEYVISAASGTLASTNYSFTYESGKMSVTRAIITVSAESKVKTYGQPNPELTVSYTGFRQGDNLANSGVTGLPVVTTSATQSSGAGTYTINVAQGTLASSNYEFDFKNGSMTIQKAVIKVTADDKTRNYGEANPQWSISYNGFVNGETLATSGISGTPQVTTEANSSSAAGNYAINVSAGTLVSSNYSFDWVSGKLTVEKVLVVITADNKTRTYGEENPTFTASYFGFVNGETFATSKITGSPEFFTSADATSPVGEYVISLRLGTLASANYNFTYLDGSLQVTKTTVTVSADDKSKIYGEANPALTVSYNGLKNGETLATSGITGTPSLVTDATATSGVGNYAIQLTAGTLASTNYSFVYADGKLTVNKAVVAITAEDKTKVYGQSNPALTYNYSGFVNGESLASSGITGLPILTTTANATSGAGVYDIVVENGTLASSNYSFQLVNGKLNISKAVVTVSAEDKTKVFGQDNPELTASFTGFVNGETLATSGLTGQPSLTTSVTASTGVGSYPISIEQGTLASFNYSFVLQEGKLAVTKAVITVTADDKSKTYGSANPAFTASYNGFVNGETMATSGVTGAPSFNTSATISSAVGNYAIIPVPGTLASSNYSFVYVDGKLSIGKATVTVTAENKNRVYGEANPDFTAAYNGFVNGESLATSGITGMPSLTTSATTASSVGAYEIVADNGTMSSANYSFNFVNGKLSIGKAVVTVKADDKIKVFGQSNPVLTATYNGFVNGETLSTSGISGQPVITTEVTSASEVGSYPITIQEGTLAAINYSFVLQEGKFKVSKAVITVTAEDKTKVYGSANPVFTVIYNGFVNGETMATSGMSGTPVLSTLATAGSGVGAYDITVSQGSLSASNYDFNYVSGKLSVTKATLQVIAVDTFRLYGAADPEFSARYEGFVNGEVLASSGISGTPSFTTDATVSSPVDVYTLTPGLGTLVSSNYQFEYVKGKFNVGKATVTVKADNATRLYGQANPGFTASYSGFANGETLATSGIMGLPSLVTAATASSATGTYDINASVGSLFSHNYTFSYEKGTLTVGKAVIKVKADDKSRSYGIANPELTVSYNGFVNGETLASSGISGVPVLNTSATSSSETGVYDITVSQGTLASTNYSFSFEVGKLTIGRNIITVTADKMTRKYGASNPVFTASFNGFLNGETLATSGITGMPAFTTVADPSSPVGEYAIVINKGSLSSANYEFAFVNGFLNVEKATIKVTPVNATRTYGAANPDFTATYNGFVNGETFVSSGVSGDPVLTTEAIATSPVGTYAIEATIGSLAASNYDFSFAKGDLQITKAQLTVTADAKTRPYGNANPSLTATITGFVNGETLATSGVQGLASLATDATVNSPVGQYTLSASEGSLVSGNYSFTYATGKLSVTKATITVKADDKSRPYGSNNPALTVSYSGFVNGETLGTSGVSGSVAVSTNATVLSTAGQYDIVSALGTLAASNYDFQFEKGTLTVSKVTITVTIENKSRTYGAVNPVFTAIYNGFVSGETLATSGITGTPVLSTTAVANSPVGSYDINGSTGTLASSNYDFNFIKGTLQIGKATITVKADDIDKSYGNAVPALTVSYIGLLNGESLATSGITGSPDLNTTAIATSPLGTYPISIAQGSLASGNYSFILQPGILTVGKAVITVTAESKVRTYGENNPQLTFMYSGFVNGETLATSGVTGTPVIYTNANVMTDAGDHDIIVAAGTLASSSYDFKFVKGTLTIRKAMLTVTPEHKSRSYGAPDPAFTVTYSGFVYGELLFTSAITGSPVMTTNATATSPVGSYEIYASLGTLYSPNYDFTFAKGTLTIGKTSLLVKAKDVSRAYGSANPVFEASYTGFVNGETYATSGLTGQPSMITAANATSAVGAYDIQTGLGSLESGNYIFTFAKGTLTVNKAIINVIAEDKSRLYWEDDPALTYTFNGFVNGENLVSGDVTGAPELSTDVIPYSNAGTYPIYITPGNLTSSKYTFNMVDGNFTIRKRTLTVTPDNKSRLYGQSNPVFTASYAGFVAGENYVSSVKGAPAYTTTASVTSPIGTYDINASNGTLTADNYDFVFAKGTLTIGKAVLTVKADSKNKLYGATNPAMTVTYSGFKNGETLATSDLSGAPAFSTTANLLSPVGDYPITIAQGTLTSGNYTFQFVNSTLAVVKATILVTADNKTKVYGTPNPALTYTYTGFVNGETLATSGVAGTPVISTTATASSVAGNYDITTSLGTLTSSNYLFIFIKGTMTVAKATITVTPDNKWRVYGEQNPAFTASYSGFINGESWATSGISGAPALATTATPASGAGSYDITASLGTLTAANYTFEYAKGTLNIGKATVTVTPDNKSRIYGAANPVLTASYSGFVNGESLATSGISGSPVITTAANVSSQVGTYDINAASGSLSSSNYDFIYSKGTMTVGKATVTVTADNKSRIYGAANPVFTASFNGFVNGEGYSNSGITGVPQFTTTAVAVSPVGTYDINAATGSLSAVNYDFVFVKGTLAIGKAVLTVTAESKGRLYAEANPQFTVAYSGFVNGETLTNSGVTGTPVVSTSATIQSPAGEYAIVPAIGTLASSNYSFAFENGKLWVGKVTLNVIADHKNRPYGSVNPELTITYSGFVSGETLATSGVTGKPTISTTAITSSPMGVYPITVTIGTMSSVNYDFNFVLGNLTVGKATITVTADNKSKTYGAANPTLTYNLSGFVNGETLATSGVSGVPAMSTNATASSPVGTYDITPAIGTLTASKYDFVFVKGTLAVDKALITVSGDNKTRAYGTANPSFTVSYNGFMNGETLATSGITGAPSMTTSATVTSAAGNYAINTTAGTLASSNYKFSYVNGVLTVAKAVITVSADDKSRIYGAANPLLTATYNGFVNGETYATSGISGTPTIQTSATPLTAVGSYDITISAGSLLASNYDFRFVNGKLNIGKATIIVTPDNKSRIYGDANPNFTASYKGFVNGEVLSTSGISGLPALTTMATALSPAGDYFIYAAGGTLSSTNYDFTYESGILTIGKATVTVSADNKNRLYGQQNPALTATYTGFKNGETLATSDISGSVSLVTNAAAASSVGNYPITATKGSLASGNYDFTYVNGVLTIGKATVTITADNKSRIYGSANPAFTATYNGFVNGDNLATSGISGVPVMSTAATVASNTGTYDISIANGSLSSVNYDFNLVKGTLTIGKATVTVTADNKSRIYGAVNPDFTASYSGFVNGETLASSGISGLPQLVTQATTVSSVGTYDINASVGSLSSQNYDFTFVKGTLTIGKATIMVTADNKSRKYGEANPAFTARYSGFVNDETMASSGITGLPALVTVATPTSTVGTYEITAATGTLASDNYTFSFTSGLLTIGKSMITVTADNASRIYGSPNPSFTATYTGFVNGEILATSGILGAASMSTVATQISGVGTYPIVPSIATLFSPNYEFSFVSGLLTINKATLTVTAENKSRGYGEQNPVFTASYNGFVNGQDLASSDVTGSPSLITTATQTSNLGTYPISASKGSLGSGNYDFVMVNGTLTIGGPVCNVSGSLVVADNCYGSKISLTYLNSSFNGPYTLTINDSIYRDVYSGVPFVTAALAKSVPESIWSASVVGEDPAAPVTSAIEVGVKFRPNVDGQITGIRFYKRSGNTGTHVGSLWTVNGELLGRATFTSETATGWQQVNFSTPVTVTPGQTYVASYYAPKGNVAYTPNAFTTNRITNSTGTLTVLKGSEGGNGIYKMGAGFPTTVSADNGNYYVDVVFNNAQSISRFNLTSVISAAGCATLSESIQALDVKMQPLTGVSFVKQDPLCLDGANGSITLTAIGCNTPYSFSIDNGTTYSSSSTFNNLKVGTYQVKVKDASNYIKDTSVVLGIETAIWTGDLSTDWHNAANWSTGKVPSATTHVIIPFTAKECYITAQDVTVASIQVKQGAIFRALDNRKVTIVGTCSVLPSE